jgi:hypothetical protein
MLLAVWMAACANPAKLVEKGNYEQAIKVSIRKLSGKKNKKLKYVKSLEEAFAKANHLDMRQIKVLEKEKRAENWVEINALHQRIRRRQSSIEPLLPLYASDGYKAEFKFVKIEDLELESKQKAAEFYYEEGRKQLSRARGGDKEAAREAYAAFERLQNYYNNYKDEAQLMEEARTLGTVYILFRIQNDAKVVLPADFERELREISVRDLNRLWREVHLSPASGLSYDYHATLRLTQIEVTPELLKEREYVDDKTIEEGWEYVLDSRGNVMKDSSGNDIKVPKKVLIKARVLEVYQHKAARVAGKLEFYDNIRRELVHAEPVGVDAVFENYAATFEGDKRALSEESKRKTGNRPLPFPGSEALILQAADLLKPVVKDKIQRSRIMR